jgi:hypothetical protein
MDEAKRGQTAHGARRRSRSVPGVQDTEVCCAGGTRTLLDPPGGKRREPAAGARDSVTARARLPPSSDENPSNRWGLSTAAREGGGEGEGEEGAAKHPSCSHGNTGRGVPFSPDGGSRAVDGKKMDGMCREHFMPCLGRRRR